MAVAITTVAHGQMAVVITTGTGDAIIADVAAIIGIVVAITAIAAVIIATVVTMTTIPYVKRCVKLLVKQYAIT